MENLLSPADIAARYNVTRPTARKRMRQMVHKLIDGHLYVEESALMAWENGKTEYPDNPANRPRKSRKRQNWPEVPRDENGRPRIPRRRA